MIKWYNESDYNLQLSFLISLRSSEGDLENTMSFYFYFSLFFYQKQKISYYCTMISLTNEITIYFSTLAKEPQTNQNKKEQNVGNLF